MFKSHKTKEGEQLLVCQMTDSHLENTIKLALKKMGDITQYDGNGKLSDYEKALYGLPKMKEEERADLTKRAAEALAPYILEAMLRGIIFTEDLQSVFCRTSAVPNFCKPDSNFGSLVYENDSKFYSLNGYGD